MLDTVEQLKCTSLMCAGCVLYAACQKSSFAVVPCTVSVRSVCVCGGGVCVFVQMHVCRMRRIRLGLENSDNLFLSELLQLIISQKPKILQPKSSFDSNDLHHVLTDGRVKYISHV
jgi:hypothetical protein